MQTGTITLYHIDGHEQVFSLAEHARMAGSGQVGAGRAWSSVKPPPPGWQHEVPKYRVTRNLQPAERARYRFESPFDMGERWQYGTREIKAGEIISTTDWPHASFQPLNYGAEKVLDFFNTRMKSRMTASPWFGNGLRLDDGLSGPIIPAIDVPPPQSAPPPAQSPRRESMRRVV